MEQNFRSLFSKARNQTCESIFYDGAKVAENLIETEQEVRILHGDIHHENILQSPTRGWLTIDPKGVIGERTYDAANAFYNPMEFLNSTDIKNSIKQRSRIFSQRLGLDQKRMLEFAFAFGCLRAAWFMEDGQEDRFSLRMARTIREVLEEL